jgi:hypothetical protein
LHHRLLLIARRIAGAGRGADLARALSLPDPGPAERLASGSQHLTLSDLCGLALALGDEILEAIPATAEELLPEQVRAWIGDWRVGSGHLPNLVAPPPNPDPTIDWAGVADGLSRCAVKEVIAGRGRHLTPDVLAHRTLVVLDTVGVPHETAELLPRGIVRYERRDRLTITAVPELAGSSTSNRAIANHMYAASDRRRGVVILALDGTAKARLSALIDLVERARAGDRLSLRLQDAHAVGAADDVDIPDLSLLVLAVSPLPEVTVFVIEVIKS